MSVELDCLLDSPPPLNGFEHLMLGQVLGVLRWISRKLNERRRT